MYWEIKVLQTLENIRTPLLTALMETITFLAESIFLVILIATIYWCIDKKKGARLAWIVLGSGVINGVFKNIFRAPRPFQKGVTTPLRLETATSYSFPSGHTQSATTFWVIFYRLNRQRIIQCVGIIIVLLTALSRLYLGVHWPVDVIAGIIMGLISVSILDLLYDEEQGFTKNHVLITTALLIVMVILPIESDLHKLIGALWGLVIGGYYERKYIQFNTEGNWKDQFVKMLIGGIGLIGIYVLLDTLLPDYSLMGMIKYAGVLLWIAAGAPYLFKHMIMKKK